MLSNSKHTAQEHPVSSFRNMVQTHTGKSGNMFQHFCSVSGGNIMNSNPLAWPNVVFTDK
jgi:hypothetical protein